MTKINHSSIAVTTTLTSGINNSVTTIPVAATTGWPTAPFFAALTPGDAATEEIVLVTAVVGLNLTATRAQRSSTAKTHSSGAQVMHVLTDFDVEGWALGGYEVDSVAPSSGQSYVFDGTKFVATDIATQAELNTEASTRASADTTNATAISTEATARASADTTLQTNITAEASARATADALKLAIAQNLADLANVVTARGNLGLGTAALADTGTGAANVPTITQADARYQPLDSDLTAIAALATQAYGRSLLTLADQAALRTAIGLGALALLNTITASLISDASANGQSLITAANYAAMRGLLTLVVGTDVQAYDATLAAFAALTITADTLPYGNGSDTFTTTPLTAFGRSLIDDAAASNARTTLGLGTAAVVDTGTGAANVPTITQADARYASITHATTHATGGSDPITEQVQDIVGALLTAAAKSQVSVTYDDAANTLTLEQRDAWYGMEWSEHFAGGTGGMTGSNSGTGATVSLTTSTDQSHPGTATLITGTDTTGVSAISVNSSTTVTMAFGTGAWLCQVIGRLATLSDGTNTYRTCVGFKDDRAGAGTDCVMITYSSASPESGVFFAECRNNGTSTTATLGVTVAANTWYHFEITVNAAGTSVTFNVYDDAVPHALLGTATITTNIPNAAARLTSPMCVIEKSAGTTSRTFQIDKTRYNYVRSS